jgi:hypothetical protein
VPHEGPYTQMGEELKIPASAWRSRSIIASAEGSDSKKWSFLGNEGWG